MSTFRVILVLDDSVTVQATLLTSIQNTLASIAANPPIPGVAPHNNIEVQKLA